ncbi:MAG: hypothetical protein ACPGIC_07210 [Opitutales bacterium]
MRPYIARSPFAHPGSCSGFALVVALGLMAYVVLLFTSLASILRVETTQADRQQEICLARENALLGLQIALGELQKQLGPDQRVSARSDILERGLVAVDQHHWLGVWADPDVLSGSATDDPKDAPQLLTWLVSGNSGQAPSALTQDPAVGVAGIADPNDRLEIVGALNGSGDVWVPKVQLENGTGAFAYWVADEGTKANVQSVAADYPERAANSDPSLSLLPQRLGIQILDTKLRSWQSGSAPRSKLYGLHALDVGAGTALSEQYFHDLTAHSEGLLTDVMHGGLKLDLERVIEMKAADFDRRFLPLVDDDDRMFPSNLPPDLLGTLGNTGPRWDVLHLFPQMTRGATNSFPLTPNYESSWEGRFQLGVAPVLAHFQVYASMSIVDRGLQTDDMDNDDPSDDVSYYGYSPRMYFLPVVVLWNPYDVILDAPKTVLNWQFVTEGTVAQFGCRGFYIPPDSSTDPILELGEVEFPPFLGRGVVHMPFPIPAHRYDPGKAYIFSPGMHFRHGSEAIEMALGMNPGYGSYHHASTELRSEVPLVFKDPELQGNFELEVFRINIPESLSTDETNINIGLADSGKSFLNIDRVEFAGFARDTNILNPPGGGGVLRYPVGLDSDVPLLPVPTTQDLLFGVEVSLALPGLQIDDYAPDRARGRMLSNFNLRTRRVDRLHFPHDFPGGFGQDPENRSYNSIFLPGVHSQVNIDQYYDMASPGVGGTQAYIGHYNGSIGPIDRAVYFYLPRGAHPFYSVGDLRHIDLIDAVDVIGNEPRALAQAGQMRNHGPSFVVGSSYADAFIDFDALYQLDHRNEPYPDYSWLCNYQLWDRFFFSGIDGAGTFNYPLPFGGYRLEETIDPLAPTTDQLDALRDFEQAASQLTVSGAFNVNATSVAAWTALFASFFGEDAQTINAGRFSNPTASPVLGAPLQTGGPYANGGNTASTSFHAGYRRLNETEINNLAAAMVDQVKLRGPFTSLAQFVNRSLVSTDDPDGAVYDPSGTVHKANGSNLRNRPTLAELAADPRMMGALQAAIDTAGLNDDFRDLWFIERRDTRDLEPQNRRLPPNVPAAMGPYMAGAPGYLNQGALLARLAPALSARSDTFTVRAYGEARNPRTGEVSGRATCEAVVQRRYDYVDAAADAPGVFPPTNVVNQSFGRRFEIVALTWLDAGSL